jgi:AbrB family looped-hinge helix DNA binding protein
MIIQVKKKAQITIPLRVRKTLAIEEGDILEVTVREREMVLKPVVRSKRRIKLLDPNMLKELEGIFSAGGDSVRDSEDIYDQ